MDMALTGASTGWISLHGITWNGELPLGGQYTVNLQTVLL